MKNKGSILFLAMVIISIVLAAGLGVSMLLLRQVREAVDKETAAVAFYVADTVIEEISLNEGFETGVWHNFNFEGVEREITYKGEEEKGVYLITIDIENDYYIFERVVDEEEEPTETITAYYHTGIWWDNWASPHIGYWRDDENCSVASDCLLSDGWVPMNDASDELNEGWYTKEISPEEEFSTLIAFSDGNDGRDWGDHEAAFGGSHYHYIEEGEGVVNVRQDENNNIDKADKGYPIAIYYDPDKGAEEDWSNPHIGFWRNDGNCSGPSDCLLSDGWVPMSDASAEYGSNWHISHVSAEKEEGLLFAFSDGNDGRDWGEDTAAFGGSWYYYIERESIVNIEGKSGTEAGVVSEGEPQ